MRVGRSAALVLTAVFIGLVVATPASAQNDPAKAYERITKALDLDQETAAKLLPLMGEFREKQRDLRKERKEAMKQMEAELDKDASDQAALGSLIDKIKKSESDMAEMKIERIDAFSKVLTNEQVAKMIALTPKLEKKQRARRKKRREAVAE